MKKIFIKSEYFMHYDCGRDYIVPVEVPSCTVEPLKRLYTGVVTDSEEEIQSWVKPRRDSWYGNMYSPVVGCYVRSWHMAPNKIYRRMYNILQIRSDSNDKE